MQRFIDGGLVAQYQITSDAKYPEFSKKSGYHYPVTASAVGIAWNTQAISDADAALLQTWAGLLDPRFASRKFGMFDPATGGLTLQGYYVQYRLFGTRLWEQLAPGKPNLYASANPAAQAVGSGEIDMYEPGSLNPFETLRAKGAPVHYSYPEPIVIVPYAQFISAGAPHPNAARLFQEYALSAKAQSLYLANGQETLLPGVIDNRQITKEAWFRGPGGREQFPLDYTRFDREWPDIAKQWDAIFRGR